MCSEQLIFFRDLQLSINEYDQILKQFFLLLWEIKKKNDMELLFHSHYI